MQYVSAAIWQVGFRLPTVDLLRCAANSCFLKKVDWFSFFSQATGDAWGILKYNRAVKWVSYGLNGFLIIILVLGHRC